MYIYSLLAGRRLSYETRVSDASHYIIQETRVSDTLHS